jgi:hypothetical protein
VGSNDDGGGGTGSAGGSGNTGGTGEQCTGPQDCADRDPCTLDTCGANCACVPDVARVPGPKRLGFHVMSRHVASMLRSMQRDIGPIEDLGRNQTDSVKRESTGILAGSAQILLDRESVDQGSINAVFAGNRAGFPQETWCFGSVYARALSSRDIRDCQVRNLVSNSRKADARGTFRQVRIRSGSHLTDCRRARDVQEVEPARHADELAHSAEGR